jgi:hypothetical protein
MGLARLAEEARDPQADGQHEKRAPVEAATKDR